MNKATYILLRGFITIISVIPFSILYLFSDLCYLILYRIAGYRREVVKENLRNAFPDATGKNILDIERKFYHHLTDSFVESFKAFGMTNAQLIKRHKLIASDVLNTYSKQKQSVIIVTGHYGNWEWGALSAPLQANFLFVALYKKIKNPYIDPYIKSNRTRTGTILADITHTSEAFKKYHNQNAAFLLAADQSPGTKYLKNSIWVDFLKQDTPCLYGPEKYARKYNLPVVYLEIKKPQRGYYELHLENLITTPTECTEGEITKAYMQRLEKTILETPEYWLWSHRRWRKKRSDL